MKHTLSFFACFLLTLVYCQYTFSQEVIARWADYADSPSSTFFYATSGNSSNTGKATLERKNDEENAPIYTTTPNGFLYSVDWEETKGAERYWLARFSTEGFSQINISFCQSGSGTGPKNFMVQYETKEKNWVNLIDKATSVTLTPEWTKIQTISLPVEMENQSNVALRWIVSSKLAVSSDKTIGSSGTNRLDLSISGIADNSNNSSIQSHTEQQDAQSSHASNLCIIDRKIWIQNTTSDPIKNVYCYTLQGQALPVNIEKQMDRFCVNMQDAKPEAIIIKVISEKNTLTKKIIF